MLQNIITSVLAFASTNIDDIFILLLFFSAKNVNVIKIVIGQYIGIIALVMISFVGSLIGNFVDQRYVGILGLFPIYLGARHLVSYLKSKDETDSLKSAESRVITLGVFAVAGMTIANGADNIGVYIPLLVTMDRIEKTVLIIVFIVMTYVWCMIARYLASRPLVAKQLDRFGHIITPLVLICLGIFILIESSTFSLF